LTGSEPALDWPFSLEWALRPGPTRVAFPADRDKLGEADGLDMSFQSSLERVEIRVEIPRSVRKR
jgi:hypothetical protein